MNRLNDVRNSLASINSLRVDVAQARNQNKRLIDVTIAKLSDLPLKNLSSNEKKQIKSNIRELKHMRLRLSKSSLKNDVNKLLVSMNKVLELTKDSEGDDSISNLRRSLLQTIDKIGGVRINNRAFMAKSLSSIKQQALSENTAKSKALLKKLEDFDKKTDKKKELKFEKLVNAYEKAISTKARSHAQKTGNYAFAQQFNNSCHLSPIKNLERLQLLREKGYDLSALGAYSRRQWLGEDQEMLTSWNQAIGAITSKEGQMKYKDLYEYITSGISEGPVMPNFYDEKGKPAFSGVKGLLEFKEMPIFLINVDELQKAVVPILGGIKTINLGEEFKPSDLGVKMGIVKDKGVYKAYNTESKAFDPISQIPGVEITQDDKGTVITIDPNIEEALRKKYQLPNETLIRMYKNEGLGFEEIGQIDELAAGLEYGGHRYVPYLTSLLKLMMLSSGVGSDNRTIDENHPEYKIFSQLRAVMETVPNLWTDLDKNSMMQYHMAEIFKEDPYLKAAAEQTCDLYVGVFKNYKKMVKGAFRNAPPGADNSSDGVMKHKGKLGLDYLPGSEQMLSYAFNLRLRWLWYGMQNPKVICKACGINLPGSIAKIINFGLRRLAYRKHKIDYSKVEGQGGGLQHSQKMSYVEVWQAIRAKLMERMQKLSEETGEPVRTDFVSFDDHGWVMSFDPVLQSMQDEKLAKKQSSLGKGTILDDIKVSHDLGFAGIESWWGSDMPTFYKV